jgi:hypothetical protein
MKVVFVIASLLLLKPAAAVANPVSDSVIINNFVFDSSGSPWLGDWVLAPDWQSDTNWKTDTALLFFRDSPPGSSAEWSISLIPGPSVSRSLTNLLSGIYQLSCWAKSLRNGGGLASLMQGGNGKIIGLATFADSTHRDIDTTWIQYFLTDTLTLTSSDTVQIILSGDMGQILLPPIRDLINNITFVKLLPSGGVGAVPNVSANLRVFPNPASGELQILGGQSGEVHLFDLMGRERMNAAIIVGDSKNGSATLDVSMLPPGMYFVSDGHSVVKFVKQ